MSGCAVCALSCAAAAQSLFQTGSAGAPAAGSGPPEALYAASLFAVQPPEPRVFVENDLITIEVQEISQIKREQTLETEKEYEIKAAVATLKMIEQFFQLRVPDDAQNPRKLTYLDYENEFTGEGEYERKERITNRITARVLEVKPNGTLLLEARTQIATDEEVQVFVLSGVCRSEDVTVKNTVLSSQLFDMRLIVEHDGQIKDAANKGILSRVLDTILNF